MDGCSPTHKRGGKLESAARRDARVRGGPRVSAHSFLVVSKIGSPSPSRIGCSAALQRAQMKVKTCSAWLLHESCSLNSDSRAALECGLQESGTLLYIQGLRLDPD